MKNTIPYLVLATLSFFGNYAVADVTEKDVLTWKDGSYYYQGERFAEVSWNKFDLFWALWGEEQEGRRVDDPENPMVKRQDQALQELSKLGFRTIRFFATPFAGRQFHTDPEQRKIYYRVMDTCLALVEKNGLSAIPCLGLKQFTSRELVWDEEKKRKVWQWKKDHERELLSDANSQSRKYAYAYLEDVITRYKNRPSVLMWEISNEFTNNVDIMPDSKVYNGERKGTLGDLAQFYSDVTMKIKELDPLRMVNNGGSRLRPTAWNQYVNNNWNQDTWHEQLLAYNLVYGIPPLDIIDVHYYGFISNGYAIKDKQLQIKDYVELVETATGKPVVIGEFGPLPIAKDKPQNLKQWEVNPDWYESYEDVEAAKKEFQRTADEFVSSGASLGYWWAYSSDRKMDQKDKDRMDVSVTRNPELVWIVVEANRRLKEKYKVSIEGIPTRKEFEALKDKWAKNE